MGKSTRKWCFVPENITELRMEDNIRMLIGLVLSRMIELKNQFRDDDQNMNCDQFFPFYKYHKTEKAIFQVLMRIDDEVVFILDA